MLLLFYRLVVRPLKREPVRTALTAVAVSLGVALVLAIELAGGAAAGSFQSSIETLTGNSDFEISAVGGVSPGVVAAVAGLPYPLKMRTRIEDFASVGDRTVPLIGADLLGDSLPGASTNTSSATDAEDFQRPDSVWVGDGLGLKTGDRFAFTVNDLEVKATVKGVLGDRTGDVLVMDLAPATRLLGRDGSVDRVLIVVPPSRTLEEWEGLLRASLPEGVTVSRQGSKTTENRKMLQAFRWNLRILSYIALVVGAFLIYNTISISVVRRRTEIGILRALGATRGQILGAFLGEAVCFGLVGGVVGLVLGRILAEGAVKMVGATVAALYVSSRPGPISLGWELGVLAVAMGIGVAVLSALAPAWEASRVTPVEAMARGRLEHGARIHQARDLALAAGLGLLAWLAASREAVGGKPLFGYLATVLLIGGATFAIPSLVYWVSQAAPFLGRLFRVEALLAARSLGGSLRRTSVLVGALATAIAMMAAVAIMVGSFRETVLVWMDDRLAADLYLRPAMPTGADRHPTIAADVAERLGKLPEVDAVDLFRAYEISYEGSPATLGAASSQIAARYGRRPLMSGAAPGSVTELMTRGEYALVSEAFASKHHVKKGDMLHFALGGRPVEFRVADLYYDYSSERGYIIVDRGELLKFLPDRAASNVAVYLKRGVDLEAGRKSVEAAVAGRKVLVLKNSTLRHDAIAIFDRTFAITYALEAVAVFVAIMGVAGALLALVIDRRRELGLLRFLGGSERQVRRLILFEAGMLGLLANFVGLILGFLLSLLLIFVINKQSFGWTIQFHWPVATLLGALTAVYAATVLAGLYPARVAVRMNPIEVIHEE